MPTRNAASRTYSNRMTSGGLHSSGPVAEAATCGSSEPTCKCAPGMLRQRRWPGPLRPSAELRPGARPLVSRRGQAALCELDRLRRLKIPCVVDLLLGAGRRHGVVAVFGVLAGPLG